MIYALALVCAIAAFYQLLAIVAALDHRRRRPRSNTAPEGVSILKPIRGADPGFYDAIRSHAVQEYPQFEILFGLRDPADTARPDIERLIAEFPSLDIRLIVCTQDAPNAKVGTLMDLAKEARNPILIVNDSDISVPQHYLRDVTAPLADSKIGLVTCLYRAEAKSATAPSRSRLGNIFQTPDIPNRAVTVRERSWPSRFEALAIATEFAPSTLVAPLFGVSEFGLGSTLAFRRADLDRIGGFATIADYLADDYQLGRNIHALGLRNIISEVVVSTNLSAADWRSAWQHQLRWARTIRLSRGGGYAGLPVTFATFWALVAAIAGLWWLAIPLLAIRLAMAITCGWFVLRDKNTVQYFYLIPLRDLWGVAIWAAGLFGNTVEWRGRRLRLDSTGKIIS